MGPNCTLMLHVWHYATVDNGVPSSGALQALWTKIYLFLVLCVRLRHVALITNVDGKIRLSAVSSRLANAKPLLSSVLVSVDVGRVRRLWPGGFLWL